MVRFHIPLLAVSLLASVASANPGATGTIVLNSTIGSTYNYTITLHNTGDTPIGTFWYGWIPGYDFLKSQPTVTSSPLGWVAPIEGFNSYSIEWYNNSGNSNNNIPIGQSAQFSFSTADSLAVLGGKDAFFNVYPMQSAYVYAGTPEVGPAGVLTVTAAAPVPEPASLFVLSLATPALLRRKR
jgi:hypothetical protein